MVGSKPLSAKERADRFYEDNPTTTFGIDMLNFSWYLFSST